MPIATLKSVSLHYQLEGPESATVIAFSNSLGTDLTMWDSQLRELTKFFRVLRYDTRGHGKSSTPKKEYSLSELGEDVLQLLDVLGLDRVHICGVSLGGMTALWLAIHAPQRLLSVVACNTAARIGNPASWANRIQQVRDHGLSSIADATMERWFTQSYRENYPAQVHTTLNRFLATDPDGYVSCCAALRDADLTALIGSIAIPVLIVAGTHDPVTPTSDGRFLQEKIEASRYLELNAAHLSNIEQPETFSKAIHRFLHSR